MRHGIISKPIKTAVIYDSKKIMSFILIYDVVFVGKMNNS